MSARARTCRDDTVASASRENALKNKDWGTFARLYNGPAYAQNKYDIKLAEAYQKYDLS